MNIAKWMMVGAASTSLAFPTLAAETRTVMWFVGHPSEMKEMLRACRNNPGDAKHVPECENVTQAELVLSAAEASAVVDMTSPTDPIYWRRHPTELPGKLFACDHVAPQYWHTIYCDSAHAAVQARR